MVFTPIAPEDRKGLVAEWAALMEARGLQVSKVSDSASSRPGVVAYFFAQAGQGEERVTAGLSLYSSADDAEKELDRTPRTSIGTALVKGDALATVLASPDGEGLPAMLVDDLGAAGWR